MGSEWVGWTFFAAVYLLMVAVAIGIVADCIRKHRREAASRREQRFQCINCKNADLNREDLEPHDTVIGTVWAHKHAIDGKLCGPVEEEAGDGE